MDLANFEFFANSADAVVGATVTAHVASDTHPNPNAAAATTTTDTNGKWAFAGLSDANVYDIKIVFGTSEKWYKANAKLNIGHLYDDTSPDPNRNILPNGGMTGWAKWTRAGAAAIALSTTPTELADHWLMSISGGDSGTGNRANAPSGMNAQYCSQFSYTRVGGQLVYSLALPARIVYALRGKTLTLSIQAKQSANAKLRAQIADSVNNTASAINETVGSVVTLSVSRTIDAGATTVTVSLVTAATTTGTFTLDVGNAILDYGAVAPVFAVVPVDNGLSVTESDRLVGLQTADQAIATAYADTALLSEFISWFAKRVKEITGASNWKDAVSVALTGKVTKTGDTMTGDLTMTGAAVRLSNDRAVSIKDFAGTDRNFITRNTSDHGIVGDGTLTALRLLASGNNLLADTLKIWHEGNDGTGSGLNADVLRGSAPGPGNGLDADTVDGSQLTTILARANHTGTQAPATISPQGAGSGLDADTVDGSTSATLLARANHTGTQLAATISDLVTAVAGMTAASANAIADGAVSTAAKLANGIVTAAKLATDAVETSKIKDANVTAVKLATDAVTTAKILDANVTDAKLALAKLNLAQGGGNATITFTGGSIVIGQSSGGAGVNGMRINGDFQATGLKARSAVGHDGAIGIFHALEAPVPVFEDFGRAYMHFGEATVQIPADFANHVDLSSYHVQVTPHFSDVLYVPIYNEDHFVVKAVLNDDSEGWFSWRLVARQGDLMDVTRLGGRA